MNWNDLEVIWKRQQLPQGPEADLAILRQTFAAKSRRMATVLAVRNVSEAAAGLLVAAVFAYAGFRMKRVGWPMAVAVILVLGVTGFFIREFVRGCRQRLGAEAPLLAKLEADIAELRHQRRLLLRLRSWYLAPLAVAMIVVGGTIAWNDPNTALLLKEPFILFALTSYVILCVVLFWGVWVLNRRAVQQQLDPRLAELEKLQRDLLSSS
ncbi:MAG: hypothetical protein NTV51_27755 [Verrucomicrobia bacterium]|nr:hypothetical protein [Verrucomicrobiota bacterium]